MKISKKIIELNKLAQKALTLSDYSPEWVMIGIDFTNDVYQATVMFEEPGDGYPSYMEHCGVREDDLIMCGVGDTLPLALNDLEFSLKDYIKKVLEEDNV